MERFHLDWNEYAAVAREAVAEGCVLLKNEEATLPLHAGEKVSVFGRIQCHYIKSGTGSGGSVNTRYVVGILEGLDSSGRVTVDPELRALYADWVETHPFDMGKGWAQEPWSQEEMPLEQDVVAAAAARSDAAIVIIGRTAGEDRDNNRGPGSLLLTDLETDMIDKVCRAFRRVVVVLNVGNLIDMKWVESLRVPAVLVAWQGGMEGGNGVADVLTGRVNPSGRLSGTIAADIDAYPSSATFGGETEAVYNEDIYVGYRYFETVARGQVLYPFGFGLSYTTFRQETEGFDASGDAVRLTVCVTNTGATAGKDVVQAYVEAPQGRLGKPARSLVSFTKTGVLAPGASEVVVLSFAKADLASYDDGGATGNRSCWVLEAGEYGLYAGADVRRAGRAGSFTLPETVVTQRLTEALAPVKPFERLKPVPAADGFVMTREAVPLRTVDRRERIRSRLPAARAITGDLGIRLVDVLDGRAALDDFIAQLSETDLACLVRGEGMCSPKVTPGTASAFGGVTERLKAFGIPVGCCADGPSGIRMDSGSEAFSLPNGTALASSFNLELVERLFVCVGRELRRNRVDTLLGPGMNLHRNPLNGRNFEYFSEDPLLTGRMAAAQLRGMHRFGVTGTIKHFAANNQEFHRHDVDAVVSERALRELYLKGFELAVREGGAYLVMTAYNPINGLWTASNHDLLSTVLRGEWGFDGMVMTDWWAKLNEEGVEANRTNTAAMVRSQNDVYMVVTDAAANSAGDNTIDGLADGRVTLGELQRAAANILGALLRLPAMIHFTGRTTDGERAEWKRCEADGTGNAPHDLAYLEAGDGTELDVTGIDTRKGATTLIGLSFRQRGQYALTLRLRTDAPDLAQVPLTIHVDGKLARTITLNGMQKDWVDETLEIGSPVTSSTFLRLQFANGGMQVGGMRLSLKQAFTWL
mgnify:CR=1 FL=1